MPGSVVKPVVLFVTAQTSWPTVLPRHSHPTWCQIYPPKPWSHPWLLLSFIRLFLFSNYVQKLSPAHCLHGAPLVRTSAIPHLLPALPPTAASQHFGWSDRFMCESHHLSRPRNERQSHRGRQGPTRSHVQHSLAQSAPNTLLS